MRYPFASEKRMSLHSLLKCAYFNDDLFVLLPALKISVRTKTTYLKICCHCEAVFAEAISLEVRG